MANKHDVQLRTQLLEKLFPTVETVDNLDSDNANRPLSARQGKVLKELIKSGGGGSGLSIEVVETLPSTGSAGILYLVPKSSYLKEENKYDEYVWVESTSKYELLGSFSTDLDINELKEILGEISQINVATLQNNGINDYVTTGTYRIYGERINAQDGLPIINAGNGHTVEGILKVYDSSIPSSVEKTDKVVTQILSMSNRVGDDGHIWIRTGQGSDKENLTWSTWEKLQGIFEKNTIDDISKIDTFTTNGIYSCMYVGEHTTLEGAEVYTGSTLLIIAINGYMASKLGKKPHLTQSIILNSVDGNKNYHITRSAIYDDNVWNFMPAPNIVLEHFCACNAYIGTSCDALGTSSTEARINIGTYPESRVSINNAFIGKVDMPLSTNVSEPVMIAENVNIGSYVDITSGAIINRDYIYLGNIAIGTNISSEYSAICYIKENVTIGNNVTIGDNTAIAENVNIGSNVILNNSGISIGSSITIGTDNILSSDTNVYIGEKVFIGPSVKIISTIGTNIIQFEQDRIIFTVNNKSATIQLT